MSLRPLSVRLQELGRFALVGGVATLLHGALLLALGRLGLPLPLANLAGFVAASFWGYLAHAGFTFHRQTGGRRFARRWLLLQMGVNLALSLALPAMLGGWARRPLGVLLLVFTPTAVNLVIWKLAARHTAQRQAVTRVAPLATPRCHADDLGLDGAVNQAIFRLYDRGCLQGASLLVNGPALTDALAGLRDRPGLDLCLHLCLTEGPPLAEPALIPLLLDRHGHLAAGFGRLLLASLLPRALPWRRRLERQLLLEIEAQIAAFQPIRPAAALAIDGHQHVHLVPIVLECLLALEQDCRPGWLRRLREPLPSGLGPAAWFAVVARGGLLKWLLLRGLDRLQAGRLATAGLAANGAFAGILFTGRMAGAPLLAAWRRLAQEPQASGTLAHPLLLLHPSLPGVSVGPLKGFGPSRAFYASCWRAREYEALAALGSARASPVTLRMK
ncbi:MAG: ChbG/HpnK family deacetylase [Cyanobacteriota bacterium]|nr:ChbG/HpnK family deacetylase [Cyanobacteriota bacterium]